MQRRLNIPPGDDNWRAEATSFATPEGRCSWAIARTCTCAESHFLTRRSSRTGGGKCCSRCRITISTGRTFYRLSDPIPLPPRTRLKAVAHFDNSDENLSNPDPKKTVRWGDQTWDEMMIGYFDLAIPRDPDHPDAAAKVDAASRIELIAQTFDRNGDGKITKDELPERLKPFFDSLDKTKRAISRRKNWPRRLAGLLRAALTWLAAGTSF